MELRGEAFSQRLETFATSTFQLILDTMNISREVSRRVTKIVSNSENSEEDIVRLLKELRNQK